MSEYKKGWTILFGNEMPYTYFGMKGCVHGMYCQNSETYFYGIKGVFGLVRYKQWGSDY